MRVRARRVASLRRLGMHFGMKTRTRTVHVGGVRQRMPSQLRLSVIRADKERCPMMHFPSVVHLAPRQNDLFDVYSRSLTLIKITDSLAGSLLSFLFFSSSSFFPFLSFFLRPLLLTRFSLQVRKDSPGGWEQLLSGYARNFCFLPRRASRYPLEISLKRSSLMYTWSYTLISRTKTYAHSDTHFLLGKKLIKNYSW